MTNYILETHDLNKQFGSVTAVDQINLQVRHGKLFGFLGPNGVGKTTTISMAPDLVAPGKGRVESSASPLRPTRPSPCAASVRWSVRPRCCPICPDWTTSSGIMLNFQVLD
jgi:ABC-type multidrug transport system ATPase subunit